jgi:UDP-N-acetylmuramoylalanine--D-glutamate ligase
MTRPPAAALVVGFGVSGAAASKRLRDLGYHVVAVDDGAGAETRARAHRAGVELVEQPDRASLADLVARAALVVPSPGVPPRHPVFALARAAGVGLESEIGLAADALGARLIAITGTNGKTTVTTMVADMLVASGVAAVAAGNVGLPLTSVLDRRLDAVVLEVSSFQLTLSPRLHAHVGAWLNLAPDHMDWHGDAVAYAEAKRRVWANQSERDVAVANADDPIVMAATEGVRGRVVTFGLHAADYAVVDGTLRTPEGDPLVDADDLWRALPHDVANALAASAAALAGGATLAGVRRALRSFRGLPHRLTLVGDARGVRWYDDSKATNPHAAVAAVRGFDSVVLIAGGQNKGLDLGAMAEVAAGVRAVVAIGAAAGEVEAAFAGLAPVTRAGSMREAVHAAAGLAERGDAVLLSPGCASFDWYRSYAERGDDFARAVADEIGGP